MKPRPGNYEVYPILVPCALSPGGKHEIKIRLRLSDNRVTFEGACRFRVADAHDRLVPSEPLTFEPSVLSCLPWIRMMRGAIHSRTTVATDLIRCHTCSAYVPEWRNNCLLVRRDQSFHRVDRATLPFWQRIVRSGRVR